MSPESGRTVELRLRAAVESSPSGLLMIDADGHIVLLNREIERLFDYSREELLGRSVDLLVPDRFRAGHDGFRTLFLADPKVRSMGAGRELYGRRRDGSEVPVEIGLTPVVTDEGMFVLSSIVDISARKRAEERFRVAVESSPNGMVMIDREGRIVLVNREVERMFGFARDELIGATIELLVPERFRARHPEHRAAFYQDPTTRSMGAGRDLFGLRKDGTEIPVEIGLNPIETDEGVLVLGSIVDISARKRAEQERIGLEEDLRHSQKMEAVGTLAGGVAHDFNNVLGAILGYAELAREDVLRGSAAERDLQELLKSVERGRQLVQRILTFSRRQETTRRPLAVGPTLQEAVTLLRAALPASIDILLTIHPSTPRVYGDTTSLHQVLTNLATNAAHAMPNGGVLEVRAEPFYARDSFARAHPEVREGSYAKVVVRDNGTGMDKTTLERAFEPFYTTKQPGSGTGLGLAMVHAIIRDHQGLVELSSEVGVGTEARFFLPALEGDPEEEAARPRETPRGKGERVLYVDDEPSLARIGERRLTELGYLVTAVTDSAVALEAFLADPGAFDLVVTDYSMPKLTGVELARRINARGHRVPVLLLTGFVEDLPERTFREAGIVRALTKPVARRDLALALRELLDAREG